MVPTINEFNSENGFSITNVDKNYKFSFLHNKKDLDFSTRESKEIIRANIEKIWLEDKQKFNKYNGYKVVTKVPDGSGERYNNIEMASIIYIEGLFSKKLYTTEENIINSPLLGRLGRWYYFFSTTAEIDLNRLFNMIAFLTNYCIEFHQHKKDFRLPDKMLAKFTHTSIQKIHLIMLKLKELLPEYINVYYDIQVGCFKVNINAYRLIEDPLLNEICAYRKLYKIDRRAELNWQSKGINGKYRLCPDNSKVEDDEPWLINSGFYSACGSRAALREVILSITWWYSFLLGDLRTNSFLIGKRIENGQRGDVMYLEIPISIICHLTGLSGTEIMTRLKIWCRSVNYMKLHDKCYSKEDDPEREWYLPNDYSKNHSLRSIKFFSDIDELKENTDFNVSSYSLMIFIDKFKKTDIKRKVDKNEILCKQLLLQYFKYNSIVVEKNTLEKDVNKKVNREKMKYQCFEKFYAAPLTRNEIDKMISLIDEDSLYNDKEFRRRKRNFLNKDKFISIPPVSTRNKYDYYYKQFFQKDNKTGKYVVGNEEIVSKYKTTIGNTKDILSNGNIFDLVRKEKSTNYYYRESREIASEDEVKENVIKNYVKKPVNQCIKYFAGLVKQLYSVGNKKLGNKIKEFNKMFSYIKQGFLQSGNSLNLFLDLIKKYRLGSYFTNCEEAKPYLTFILHQ